MVRKVEKQEGRWPAALKMLVLDDLYQVARCQLAGLHHKFCQEAGQQTKDAGRLQRKARPLQRCLRDHDEDAHKGMIVSEN